MPPLRAVWIVVWPLSRGVDRRIAGTIPGAISNQFRHAISRAIGGTVGRSLRTREREELISKELRGKHNTTLSDFGGIDVLLDPLEL